MVVYLSFIYLEKELLSKPYVKNIDENLRNKFKRRVIH